MVDSAGRWQRGPSRGGAARCFQPFLDGDDVRGPRVFEMGLRNGDGRRLFGVDVVVLGICVCRWVFVPTSTRLSRSITVIGSLCGLAARCGKASGLPCLFSPLALCAIPVAPLHLCAGRACAGGVYPGDAVLSDSLRRRTGHVDRTGVCIVLQWARKYAGRHVGRCFFAVVNLLLDYVWIFGYAGFPALGIAGAGWATVTALWLKVVCYVVMVLQAEHRKHYGTLAGMRFDRDLFGRLLYFGGPSGVQMLLDVIGFTVFVMLIGRLGDVQYEATSMAFSISTLGFMPIWGLGMAASILVGQRLGENRDDLAARSTWTTLYVAWAYMGIDFDVVRHGTRIVSLLVLCRRRWEHCFAHRGLEPVHQVASFCGRLQLAGCHANGLCQRAERCR